MATDQPLFTVFYLAPRETREKVLTVSLLFPEEKENIRVNLE